MYRISRRDRQGITAPEYNKSEIRSGGTITTFNRQVFYLSKRDVRSIEKLSDGSGAWHGQSE